jgi:mRNA interferase HigB
LHVISHKALKEFAKTHPDAAATLEDWYKITSKAQWRSLDGVRATFPHADLVGDCTVFNIGGNKYRLVTIIIYVVKRVYVRFVMTHAEFDRGRWKHDCGC